MVKDMVKVLISGLMVESIKVGGRMIKDMVMERLKILMAGYLKNNGTMESK